MTNRLLESFSDDCLQSFLGYRSCSLERNRILSLLADYLFDVSHAMFAWQQTEVETIRSGVMGKDAMSSLSFASSSATKMPPSHTTSHVYYNKIDTLVRDALFDQRALKKIGGWDDASLLRHAIHMSRSAQTESWEAFAKTTTGRRLLAHHRSGRAFVVGQKRRGQRVKHRQKAMAVRGQPIRPTMVVSHTNPPTDSSDSVKTVGVHKSDASVMSTTSTNTPDVDAADISDTETTTTTTNSSIHTTVAKAPVDAIVLDLPAVRHVVLSRDHHQSWGILLAREGDLCVVDRAPKERQAQIRQGDMILSVRNECGQQAGPPSSSLGNQETAWFRNVVGLFKKSSHLRLEIRRVASSHG